MTILGLLSRYSPISDRHAIAFASKLGYEKLKIHGVNSVGYVKIAFTIFLLLTFLSILLLIAWPSNGSVLLMQLLAPSFMFALLLIYPIFVARKAELKEFIDSVYCLDFFAMVANITGSVELASQYACGTSKFEASKRFRRALLIIRGGTNSKKAILIAFGDNKRYHDWLKSVIYGSESDVNSILMWWNAEMVRGLLKVEDVMAFFTVLTTLLPVITSIIAIIWGLGSSPLIFVVVVLQPLVFMVVYLWFKDLTMPVE